MAIPESDEEHLETGTAYALSPLMLIHDDTASVAMDSCI